MVSSFSYRKNSAREGRMPIEFPFTCKMRSTSGLGHFRYVVPDLFITHFHGVISAFSDTALFYIIRALI